MKLSISLVACSLVAACGGDTHPTVTVLPDAPPAVMDAGSDAPAPVAQKSFVYVETNDPAGNAILAFERMGDGTIAFHHGVYDAFGTGITAGADQRRGPLDGDRELVLSDDARVLYAVNEGSATIAAFAIGRDGGLEALGGSPYRSPARNPSSLAIVDRTLYMVDKAIDGTSPPSLSSVAVDAKGELVTQAGFDMTLLPRGASPATAVVTPDAHFVATTMYYDEARVKQLVGGQLAIFVRGDRGMLAQAVGSPIALPSDPSADPNSAGAKLPVALGLAVHPTEPVMYVGFPTRGELGVYAYDATTGTPTFVTAVAGGGGGLAWPTIVRDGQVLFAIAGDSGTLVTYDLSDPREPIVASSLVLRHAAGSRPAQVAFDVAQHHLYVVSQRVATDPAVPAGNYLHTIAIAPDGTLLEANEPIDLRDAGVSPDARPQGVVVVEPIAIR